MDQSPQYEFKYIIITENGTKQAKDFETLLSEGWIVLESTPLAHTIHYILSRTKIVIPDDSVSPELKPPKDLHKTITDEWWKL